MFKDELSEMRALSEHLRTPLQNRTRHNCASALDMRSSRERVAGWLKELVDREELDPVFATVIPHKARVPHGELHRFDARKFMQCFRTDLNRAGASSATGGLVAGLDIDSDPRTEQYTPHVHAIVWGGHVDAINNLRKTENYRFDPDALARNSGAIHPIMLIEVRDRAIEAMTYIMKTFSSERPTYVDSEGETKRWSGRRRLREPQHTEMMLWLNKQRLSDIYLMMGVRVTRKGFQLLK